MNLKSSLFALLFLALAAALFSQPADLSAIPLEQDPAVLSGRFANGMAYYIMRNPKPAKVAELRLYVDAGSVSEDNDQRGLAHFTEHMAFNGTKNFAKSEVVNYLSSIGMGYHNGLNAMTSYDYTVYTFKIPTDDQAKLRQGLLILSDMAHQVSFEDPDIERERGVIIEEWRMGQDAGTRVRDAQNAVTFAGSRYAERSPIGTFDVLSTFTPATLKRFYQDWYRPDMQSVVIVGDFEPEAMLALAGEYFGAIPASEDPRGREDFSVPENLTPRAVVATDKEYPMNLLQVMWKKEVEPVQNLGGYLENLRRNLFYTMLNARLDEHSKKPDPPFSLVGAYEYPMLRTMSAAMVMAVFTEGKSEQALSTILTEAERVQRYGFLPTEFERAKIELLRQAEQSVAQKDTRESDEIAWGLVDAVSNHNVFMSPDQDYQIVSALLQMVTLEEVNAIVGRLIQEKNMVISIGAPAKEGLSYPTEERLLQIAQTTNTLEIAPYEDKTVNEPLMAEIPAAKPIKKESFDAQTGVRTWVLANGVTVLSKKTDFKADEIMLSATSPGGYCLYPPQDIPAANFLSGYINESGFGSFDAVSLSKATVGKVAHASVDIGLYSESLQGSCSPKDMELMFQLIHQYATNPRFDPDDFSSYIQRTKAFYQNRNLDPMNVFMDRLNRDLFGDHPYLFYAFEVNFDEVKLADMERIFRDRFGDFSDFTFIIVGNFDETLLKQYCQAYLGNLPSLRRVEKAKDVGMRMVKGAREIRFNKGTERSFVAHFTHGKHSYSLEKRVMVDALQHVLNEKLRENIREERSGVYFIQGWIETQKFPAPVFSLGTMMACSPARVDELNTAIFATLDSLRDGHLDDRYVVAARATLEQQFSEDIRSNRFWQSRIRESLVYRRPLSEFLDEPGKFDRISKKALVKAAKSYLNFPKNKLSLIMLPEAVGE